MRRHCRNNACIAILTSCCSNGFVVACVKFSTTGVNMIKWFHILMMLCLTAPAGCTGDKGKELYETARFEEQQHNNEHARQLYEDIVKKHPGSEFATKAAERLRVIPKK